MPQSKAQQSVSAKGRDATRASKTTFKWPWHEISDESRPPTGVMMCRFYGIPNQGPRVPAGGTRARDHDPKKEQPCLHEFNNHGGNAKAFWSQCSGCKTHVEYYPTGAPGMKEICEQLEEFKIQEAEIKGWQPRASKLMEHLPEAPRCREAKARAGPKPRARPTSTQSGGPPVEPEDQTEDRTERTEQEEWEMLGEEAKDQSPRSKALGALRELLQDENANATTNELVENLRGHLGADINDL